jgi:hypothetical protein
MTQTNNTFDSKYSEDWLPVKAIANGMIQTDDGYYVTGVKVVPKNIFILDEGSQNNVLFQMANFYNTIDYEFWLLIADRPVDISVYLSGLQVMYNQASNPSARKLIMQDINKANLFMSEQYNVVDTEYYIIFREKKMEIVQKRIHNLISGLAGAGIQSTQTSNNDLRMILDNYLNDGQTTNFRAVM